MDDDAYSSCRIVSIAWIVLSESFDLVTKGYFVIKPAPGVEISKGSISIHGITNEIAHETGYDLAEVVKTFKADMERCTHIVAHNISFDYGVLMHELYLLKEFDLIRHLKGMCKTCTMLKGKQYLNAKKWPKLGELYAILFEGKVIKDAHNAMADASACADCFCKMSIASADDQINIGV